ncbi:hypothetical protein [Pontibacter sp. HSC-36F09]|uniref:hypothetical protein n=1 Tax=Pontibacter sp. HSC-36F09 TaxID=2910966 RepID=UPI00209FBE68|nr:hypothetical protein [Pontibacter sp. HSC-36F09]MCP2044705.1 uncharacterized membrane-anchored protein YhcB (DUF1043 family) [Pontibacter sp. HSC-36F09]
MSNITVINKIELHYFFNNGSHSMDAYVRNKCEAELLAIVREIATLAGIQLKVETEPYKEGGLREIFELITKNQFLLPIITSIISGVVTGFVVHRLNSDSEFEDLQKQKLRLEIKKLEKELNESSRSAITLDTTKAAEVISNNSYKIAKHKSNFYKALASYPKITQISFSRLNSSNEEVTEPRVVSRQDFDQFILDTDELPSVLDNQAEIEIISPVLKPGPYKWKGYYTALGETIDFYMKDSEFKSDILSKGIAFRSGTRIDCVLEIARKITETGEIINSSYAVSTVLTVRDDKATVETPQGKKYKVDIQLRKKQLDLFS